MLPPVKRVNVLEEAEFVEVDGGFEKEKMLQCESSETLLSLLYSPTHAHMCAQPLNSSESSDLV